MLSTAQIRDSFLTFFKDNKHHILDSASLLPQEDHTLLFTSAGMVPFKSYFSGISPPPHKQVVTIQKCMRTTDIEEVGKTKRHLSFFEMMGNFSFGAYFKQKAIELAWEYTIEHLQFNKELIWVSVYQDDNEAYSLWKDHIGIPTSRIVRLGEKHNFWGPVGSTGICGPCSELYLDRGVNYDINGTCNQPGDEGERFLEFWNLVFNQYEKDSQGIFHNAQSQGIDTGAGLERIALLTQNVDSVFDTDDFQLLTQAVTKLYDINIHPHNQKNIYTIIDHVRSSSFAITDGIYPSNEFRGYVVRKIIRIAILSSKALGQHVPILYRLVTDIINTYKKWYPELEQQKNIIKNTIQSEEKKFLQTLDFGMDKFQNVMENSIEQGVISGADAFLLYDTFGFPIDMTQALAQQEGISVDMLSFHVKLQEQKTQGKRAWQGQQVDIDLNNIMATYFIGHENTESQATVLGLWHKQIRREQFTYHSINNANNNIIIATEQSPFYPESGGQIGDIGYINLFKSMNQQKTRIDVYDTQIVEGRILHYGVLLEGTIRVADKVYLVIDKNNRDNLKKSHSATHLLNAALNKILGNHIKQSGSLVHKEYLRFDFTHPAKVIMKDIVQIETTVNQAIQNALLVKTVNMPKENAKKLGAVMTFNEKYGDEVRVVTMGDVSCELCGGTHVTNTKDINVFLIVKESSVGSGSRRIEAIFDQEAIMRAHALHQENQQIWHSIQDKAAHQTEEKDMKQCAVLFTEGNNIPLVYRKSIEIQAKLRNILSQTKKQHKKTSHLPLTKVKLQNIIQISEIINSKTVIFYSIENTSIQELKQIADALRGMKENAIFILQSILSAEQTWSVVIATSEQYSKLHSFYVNDMVKSMLPHIMYTDKVGGGGKKILAQISGKIAEGAIDKIVTQFKQQVSEYIAQ